MIKRKRQEWWNFFWFFWSLWNCLGTSRDCVIGYWVCLAVLGCLQSWGSLDGGNVMESYLSFAMLGEGRKQDIFLVFPFLVRVSTRFSLRLSCRLVWPIRPCSICSSCERKTEFHEFVNKKKWYFSSYSRRGDQFCLCLVSCPVVCHFDHPLILSLCTFNA